MGPSSVSARFDVPIPPTTWSAGRKTARCLTGNWRRWSAPCERVKAIVKDRRQQDCERQGNENSPSSHAGVRALHRHALLWPTHLAGLHYTRHQDAAGSPLLAISSRQSAAGDEECGVGDGISGCAGVKCLIFGHTTGSSVA